jgi:lipopolysaccharide transport system permease protein
MFSDLPGLEALLQRAAMPDWLQPWLIFNPLTVPVEAVRNAALFGTAPDWTALGLYTLAAIVVAFAGEAFFQATRRGFADVL